MKEQSLREAFLNGEKYSMFKVSYSKLQKYLMVTQDDLYIQMFCSIGWRKLR